MTAVKYKMFTNVAAFNQNSNLLFIYYAIIILVFFEFQPLEPFFQAAEIKMARS